MERVSEEKHQFSIGKPECLDGEMEQRGVPEKPEGNKDAEQEQHVFKLSLPLEACHGIGFLLLILNGSH